MIQTKKKINYHLENGISEYKEIKEGIYQFMEDLNKTSVSVQNPLFTSKVIWDILHNIFNILYFDYRLEYFKLENIIDNAIMVTTSFCIGRKEICLVIIINFDSKTTYSINIVNSKTSLRLLVKKSNYKQYINTFGRLFTIEELKKIL